MTEPPRELNFPDAVTDASDLFGRQAQLAEIKQALPLRTVVILGGRKLGKNSILNVVAQWADMDGRFAVIRLGPANSHRRLMTDILQSIQRWVATQVPPGRVPTGAAVSTGLTTTGLAGALYDLGAQVPGRRFLLCVDELDSLLQACAETEARQILDLIEHLATQPQLPLVFLFTMTRIPDLVRRAYRSPLLSHSTRVDLQPWPQAQAKQFVEWLLDERLVLDQGAHQTLFRATGGHPYFTKAALQVLLDAHRGPAGQPVSAEQVRVAVARAATSPEVDSTLWNLVNVHLPPDAPTALDRAATTPAGLTTRDLAEFGIDDDALTVMLANGLLTRRENRYPLRLGLWQQWRAARSGWAERRLARLFATVRRVVGGRTARRAMLATLVVLAPVVVFGLVFAPPRETWTTIEHCPEPANGLRVQVSHPTYVSYGDAQALRVRVRNATSESFIDGLVLVDFPGGRADIDGDSAVPFDGLRPSEQRGGTVSFTSIPPDGDWLPDTRDELPILLTITANGSICQSTMTLAIAPLRHVQRVRDYATSLAVAVLLPLLLELWLARRRRAGTPPPHAASVPAQRQVGRSDRPR